MNGTEKAAWSNDTGTHTLRATEAVTELPESKPELVTAQIHGGDDDVMQIRLEGNHLMVQYADGAKQVMLDPDYRLGTPYDIEIVAADAFGAGVLQRQPEGRAPALREHLVLQSRRLCAVESQQGRRGRRGRPGDHLCTGGGSQVAIASGRRTPPSTTERSPARCPQISSIAPGERHRRHTLGTDVDHRSRAPTYPARLIRGLCRHDRTQR